MYSSLKTNQKIIPFEEYPNVLSTSEMASMLGISVPTAYKLINENKIKSTKINKYYKICKVHVLEYLGLIEKDKDEEIQL